MTGWLYSIFGLVMAIACVANIILLDPNVRDWRQKRAEARAAARAKPVPKPLARHWFYEPCFCRTCMLEKELELTWTVPLPDYTSKELRAIRLETWRTAREIAMSKRQTPADHATFDYLTGRLEHLDGLIRKATERERKERT